MGLRNNNLGRIGILMGGPSSEREISLKSGKAVYESLKALDMDVVGVDITTDKPDDNISLIKSHRIDCAFIALHGRFGEDGQVQAILDSMDIPYTGSGMLASRLAMDKVASRRVLEIYGLDVPRYKVLDKVSYNTNWKSHAGLNLPLVVKPATHGSSIGLSIVDSKDGLDRALDLAFGFDDNILIEEYISGREITVGILHDRALPVIEIVPKNRLFDYEAKYKPGLTDYLIPAPIEEGLAKKLKDIGLSVHRLLGCFGCSRIDMILSKDGRAFVLELNSIPGLTPTSLLPKAAKVAGIEFPQLCLELVKTAYEKS